MQDPSNYKRSWRHFLEVSASAGGHFGPICLVIGDVLKIWETTFLFFQNQYFLVKDVCPCSDRLGTLGEYAAPNVRRCRGRLPIYGMGQPTRHGLNKVIDSLKEDGFQVSFYQLHWRHMSVMAAQLDSLFKSFFGLATMKTQKLLTTGALWGESTGDQWIPCVMTSPCYC